MSKIDEILTKVDHKAGYKVPEGYFADFTSKMMEALPEKKIEEHRKPTREMRIRPFIYMAAMFGGVWLMLYMFNDLMGHSSSSLQYDEQIADAMQDDKTATELMKTGQFSDYDILNDIYENGESAENIDFSELN